MSDYVDRQSRSVTPRLPLEGSLDLTYRCNLNCRHCWLWRPASAPEKGKELDLNEIKGIVDQARSLGCREWNISGGEPMLRPDFGDIFEYVTSRAASYTLNTNGTLITPGIARLLRRRGTKMVALYGATPEVYDRVTRRPGGFELAMQGFAYLREAGAGFIVQLIPMRENYHQWTQMVAVAESLSSNWRVGAAWLYLSARGSEGRSREIRRQRLTPTEAAALDPLHPSGEGRVDGDPYPGPHPGDDRLFAPCIAGRRSFHVDPYGRMSFCCFVKDPALRYDLRLGTVQEGWENFIPSLADRIRGGPEYLEHCGSCELRADCRWCPVYGYLEHRRFSAPVEYLCATARENRRIRLDPERDHRRLYRIAGITVQVESDLPIVTETFARKFEAFQVDRPGSDTVLLRHHFSLPAWREEDLGERLHKHPPWAVYRKHDSWVYVEFVNRPTEPEHLLMAVFSRDYSKADIYHRDSAAFRKGGVHSLALFPTDQLWLAWLLAARQACFIHASAVVMNGQGLLFVGHSGAGKSTICTLLEGKAEVLCDDRIIVRRWPHGFLAHGTWSHGSVPLVSARSAPLRAVLFLEQASENQLAPLGSRNAAVHRLLATVIKPVVNAEWWTTTMDLIERLAGEVPCYELRFDKSGEVVGVLGQLLTG